MNLEERIAHHRQMAESYRNAYLRQGVKDGEQYTDDEGHEAWKFAADAVYMSPYFTGDQEFLMSDFPTDTANSATLEAKVYSLTFPDWKPESFKYWSAGDGFVMMTRWQGHTVDGTGMGFYSYSFVNTNEDGDVTRWETHCNDEYSRFLEVAIGVSGPFQGTTEYLDALHRRLDKASVTA
ncbi:hypothetical protein [Nocardia sp. 348MFTsu5.1]|uniref:hypothetical protein n=1 Tax=Nocardia sp. 348MFTsu5.1 TaxID=1172185 RepID=UPI00035FCF1F|nr:hypothetical protein [Nocardia sp. 348MFTsu5.1]